MHGDQIRVLQVESGCKEFTGVSNYLLQQYRKIDREKIHYDFLYARYNSMKMEKEDPALVGSEVFSLETGDEKNHVLCFLKIAKRLRKIVKEYGYDIIEVDTSSIFVAFVCRLAVYGSRGISFIAHAHTGGVVVSSGCIRDKHPILMEMADRVCRFFVGKASDFLFACSETAGRYTFGKKVLRQDNFRIVHNAIDLESFRSDLEVRRRVRKENGITRNTTVFGYAGRMATVKNLDFLISVFAELHRRNGDSVLWMVGEGEERKKLQARTEELGLGKSVVFFGQRPDVDRLMQGMDAFIFPSLMEGLGMVAIEAQASGLPTIISDGVPDDVMITPLVRKVSLKASASEWADAVLSQMSTCSERKEYSEELAQAGYDVRNEAKKMMGIYEQIAQQKRVGQRRKPEIRIPQTEVELDSVKAVPIQLR